MVNSEVERIINLIEGLGEEAQRVAVSVIHSDILWDELRNRDRNQTEMLSKIWELFN